ncbi:hypothetical protein DV515_00009550 [Chloebia gouldiae]|uniref:Ig-like domain-containing protein n=1 Tax=Chloebia gouldiae TaxID=44316 RepID=A0A3L8SBI9_CHLGU|nr:hypothetical protein DV515_00009550 [Chloebia gouldiae]
MQIPPVAATSFCPPCYKIQHDSLWVHVLRRLVGVLGHFGVCSAVPQGRLQLEQGSLTIPNVSLSDAGMYQCVAENRHGVIFASAELSVIAIGPDFSKTLLKKLTLVKVGGEVIIECKPKASPRPTYSWKKGKDILRENER